MGKLCVYRHMIANPRLSFDFQGFPSHDVQSKRVFYEPHRSDESRFYAKLCREYTGESSPHPPQLNGHVLRHITERKYAHQDDPINHCAAHIISPPDNYPHIGHQ